MNICEVCGVENPEFSVYPPNTPGKKEFWPSIENSLGDYCQVCVPERLLRLLKDNPYVRVRRA